MDDMDIEKINSLSDEIVSLLEKSDCNFVEVSQCLSSLLIFLCISGDDTIQGRKKIYDHIIGNIESTFNAFKNQ